MTHRFSLSTSRLHLTLMLALTFSTGVCDAIGFLGLDRVFTGNMTGNIVLIGMALGGGGEPALRPAIALLTFVLGAAFTGVWLRNAASGWTNRISAALTCAAVLLTSLAVVLAVAGEPSGFGGHAATSVLSLVMGLQAAVARKVKVAEVSTVVVTSTITALAADIGGRPGPDALWVRRTLAIGLILLGAVAGAALLLVGAWTGVALSAAITAVVALSGSLRSRSDRLNQARDEEPERISV
ncbi:hypothetical protein D477_007379 [Arthrobacter crystallopoietes BAB-32]|uniref:DUF1275 domain-containing protein n=1 Tax=Arthrobacter crystallopoietes BAB-32 TaxID=1246476 RepID=N1V0P7_9MICC|nr:YoaK family protein [Arthrobacter crystallopoietes]EMY34880.1 hypothetical protein D477_007379 [Arthrobacter crystallopoietes BAB-32]